MDDAALMDGLPAAVLAELAGVHLTTARRWKRRRALPAAVRRLLALVTQGDLGALSPAWRGWRLAGAALISPESWPATPAQVLALPLLRAQVAGLEAEARVAVQADWVDGRFRRPTSGGASGNGRS